MWNGELLLLLPPRLYNLSNKKSEGVFNDFFAILEALKVLLFLFKFLLKLGGDLDFSYFKFISFFGFLLFLVILGLIFALLPSLFELSSIENGLTSLSLILSFSSSTSSMELIWFEFLFNNCNKFVWVIWDISNITLSFIGLEVKFKIFWINISIGITINSNLNNDIICLVSK